MEPSEAPPVRASQPGPEHGGPSTWRSLFRNATGAIRQPRAPEPMPPQPPAPHRAEPGLSLAQPAAQPQTPTRGSGRDGGPDEKNLDIPTFLRRMSN
jgi:hypothetical protein